MLLRSVGGGRSIAGYRLLLNILLGTGVISCEQVFCFCAGGSRKLVLFHVSEVALASLLSPARLRGGREG